MALVGKRGMYVDAARQAEVVVIADYSNVESVSLLVRFRGGETLELFGDRSRPAYWGWRIDWYEATHG